MSPTPITSVWRAPGFLAVMIAVASAFGAWSLLLPVLPLAVIESGGSATLAGATTGVFMAATVLTQIATPWLLRTVGYRPVMVVSAFMLGVPALGHLLGMDPWIVLLFSGLRGVGFGAVTVAQSALVAELVPLNLLGKATGLLGAFVGVSQMLGLPAGLWIAEGIGYEWVYVTAAVVALIAAVMCITIPPIKAAPASQPSPTAAKEAPMWRLVLVPALVMMSLSMAFGMITSFLPATVREYDPVTGVALGGVMLSISSASAMIFRYLVGMAADRSGKPGQFIILAQSASLIGILLIMATLVFEWSVWWMVVAIVFFGGGYGAVQNESLLSMFSRLPRAKVSEASAVWNIFFDAGTGIGSVVFGAIVAASAYFYGYGAAAVVLAVGIVMSLLDRQLGRNRVAEHDNLRARLRLVRPPRN